MVRPLAKERYWCEDEYDLRTYSLSSTRYDFKSHTAREDCKRRISGRREFLEVDVCMTKTRSYK